MLLQENNQSPEGDQRSGFLKTLGVKEGQRLALQRYLMLFDKFNNRLRLCER